MPSAPQNIADDAPSTIYWTTRRAWFDECVKAARRHDLDNGEWWTGAAFRRPGFDKDPAAYEDSYYASDFENWEHIQQERHPSITLSKGYRDHDEFREDPQAVLAMLDWIEAVEEPQ